MKIWQKNEIACEKIDRSDKILHETETKFEII
jgi:hypothetical protein